MKPYYSIEIIQRLKNKKIKKFFFMNHATMFEGDSWNADQAGLLSSSDKALFTNKLYLTLLAAGWLKLHE